MGLAVKFRHIAVAAIALQGYRAAAQPVISAHSGVIQYCEGAVFIDDHAVPKISARFPEIPEGSRLMSDTGRAEVLIAPNAFLWLDRSTVIRMQHSALSDARVELLEGSVMIQSAALSSETSIALIYNDARLRLLPNSLYRLNARPNILEVIRGQAEVTRGEGSMVVNNSQRFAFKTGTVTKLEDTDPDEFDQWTLERRQAIAKANINRIRTTDPDFRGKIRAPRRRPFPSVAVPFPQVR